jgi:hypothetical protein
MRYVPQEETKMYLDFRPNELHTVHEPGCKVYYYIHKEAEG